LLASLSLFLGTKKELTAVSSYLVETFAAIYRSAFTRLKGYFSVLAAFGTGRRVHLAGFHAAAGGTAAFVLSCLTASGATLGFISVTLGLEELLFRRSEGELGAAIGTLYLFVLKCHG
jgi:hypothetical protein